MSPVLEAFGEDRIMWGSDWREWLVPPTLNRAPTDLADAMREYHSAICKIGVVSKDAPSSEQDKIWAFDYRLGLDVLLDFGLPDEALDKIFCKNAQRFYASV